MESKKRWNLTNKTQKIAKLIVVGEKKPWELDMASGDEIFINREPSEEEDIITYNDHNRIDENKLQRKIKATIKFTIDKDHPDINSVKDWTEDKVFEYSEPVKYSFPFESKRSTLI